MAFLAGWVIYKAVTKVIDFVLCKAFKMETLTTLDECFMTQPEGHTANATGAMRVSKMSFEDFRDWVYHKYCMVIPRSRSRLT